MEFLVFIALISLIFGISFSAAIVGFLKFIVISVGIIMALGLVFKMSESKKGVKLVLLASVIALILGVGMVNDNYETRYFACDPLAKNPSTYVECVNLATEKHNSSVNVGWGSIIMGLFFGAYSLIEIDKKSTKKR